MHEIFATDRRLGNGRHQLGGIRTGLAVFAALVVGSASGAARACEDMTVRDAAFDFPRDVHHLVVITTKGDPRGEAIHKRLADWLASSGAGLNLDLAMVSADDPDVRWSRYGIPSAPPSAPVVVLSGHRETEETGFYIAHWEPAPSDEDLEALKSSPARAAIRSATVKDLAVLLYVPGSGSEGGQAESIVKKVAKTWSAKPLPDVSVVRLDRSDARERLLLSFIGIEPESPDWVTVIFGRGKIMSPLMGSEITEGRLGALLEAVAGACTCVRTMASYGIDIPIVWNEAHDESLVHLRPGEVAEPAGRPESSELAAADTLPGLIADETTQPGGSGRRVLLTTLLAAAGGVIVLGFATLAIVRRKQRADRATAAG